MKRVCIVGYGAIGPMHADALKGVEHARFYAVCDVDEKRRRVCRETYDVKEYDDFDTMLQDEEIDSVHICTPHYLHFEMIKKALAAGKEVVSEKPVTMTKEEYDKLLLLPGAEKVCVVLQNRLNPCVARLKAMVDSGELGAVKAVKAMLTWHRDQAYYDSGAWRGRWATEGGCLLINQAVHTLDMFRYVIGDIACVKTCMSNFSLEGVIEAEDTLMAQLQLECGVGGIFFATNAYEVNSSPFFEVVFEQGTVRYMDKQLWMGGQVVERDDAPVLGKDYWGSSHGRLMKRYYDEQKYFGVYDAKNTMEAMFAMYESAAHGGVGVQVK